MGYFDLVVFIGVLAAAAVLLPSALNWNHMAFSAQVAQVEAGQLATITDAALQYEYGNSATLEAPNSSHAVTVAQLIAQGYLPSGTRATDSFGNTISVLFNADGSGNVTGYVIDQGQKVYTDLEAGQLTLALGDRGGAVPAALLSGQHPNTIYGSGGTWQAPAPAGVAAGSIEVEVEPNATQEANDSRFLWRVAAPNAADNTMATPLILGAIETVGNSCTPGSISSASNGDLLECPNTGAWTPISGHWRSPVATYAALPGSGNNDGDVRLTEDTDRAFAWNGGSWQALAVDQNGNLTVPNQLTAENGQVSTWMGCDGHAGMSIGEINAISEPTCGAGSVGFDLGNSSTGVDTTVFNQNGLQIWNSQYGTMFHVDYQGNVSGPGYSIGTASSWGINPNFGNGWAMVTSVNGGLNAQPEQAAGSIHANDYFDRASGEWFSQVANQVNNQQSEINSQQGQINNLNNEYGSQQEQINSINNNLNQGPCSTGYNSIATLCNEIQQFGAANMGKLLATGTQGPTTYTYWTYCGSRYYRYRCQQTGEGPPTVNLTASSAPELVFASASAGIGQGGCGSSANTGIVTLSATSGGAPVDSQSGRYGKGGSNYNPNAMYFPFSLTFTLPAGQSGQIQLSGGENGLGCGSIQYAVYQL